MTNTTNTETTATHPAPACPSWCTRDHATEARDPLNIVGYSHDRQFAADGFPGWVCAAVELQPFDGGELVRYVRTAESLDDLPETMPAGLALALGRALTEAAALL